MRARGFTLVEVLVVCAVSVLLAMIAWPVYRGQLQRAARAEAIEALQRLQLAQERHRETFGVYAAELKAVGFAAAVPGGRYDLALVPSGVESYRALAVARADGPQAGDTCPELSLEVRQGFATLGPDGKCWNR